MLGHQPGGVAALGKDGDHFHLQAIGRVGHRFGDGFGDADFGLASAALFPPGHRRFSLLDDAAHHRHHFPRIASGGGFRREHQRVGSVEDGVGYVTGFCACGPRVVDHGLQHLRGGNHRQPAAVSHLDDALLRHRNFFRRHFHSQVAPRHHHPVSHRQDFFQVFERFGLFDFGQHGRVVAQASDQPLEPAHVGSRPHEGLRHVVHPVRQRKLQMFLVARGERSDAELHTRKVHSLALAQFASIHHPAEQLLPALSLHPQLDQTVGQQDAVAGMEILEQAGVIDGDAFGGSEQLFAGQGQPLAGLQLHRLPRAQPAGADLRARQVGDDGHGAADARGEFPQQLDGPAMIAVLAVGEVQPGYVHPRPQQYL